MVGDPIMDVISVAMAVKRACDKTCAAKKILAVVSRNMDSLLAVITKIQIKLDELDSAVVGGILGELHAEITKTLKLATKARKMSRVVFVVKASGIREDVELSLKAVHLSLMTLETTRNEQIAAELRDFHGAWQTRQEELREEAARERRDRDRLREGISKGGEDVVRAAGVDASRLGELQRALSEMRLERDGIRAEVGAELDSVARDKAAAEAQLIDQIIAALESAEREEARPAQGHRPPDLLSGCDCPVTGEVMTDPVIVDATCMHTVSREGLEAWFQRREMVCPVCRTDLRSRRMAPNVPLRNVIESLLKANPSHTAGIAGNAETSAPPAPSPLHCVAPPPPRKKRFHYFGVRNVIENLLETNPSHTAGIAGNAETSAPPAPSPLHCIAPPPPPRKKRWKYRGVGGDYVGDLDARKRPHGHGVLSRDDGDVYEGEWKNGERDGRGMLRLPDGDVYEGGFKNGKFEGRGTYRWSDGRVAVVQLKDGKLIGEGVRWSADRKTAHRLMNGSVSGTISLEEAKRIADRFGLPVPI